MDRYFQRQKLLNRLADAEEAYRYWLQAKDKIAYWKKEILKIQTRIEALDEPDLK